MKCKCDILLLLVFSYILVQISLKKLWLVIFSRVEIVFEFSHFVIRCTASGWSCLSNFWSPWSTSIQSPLDLYGSCEICWKNSMQDSVWSIGIYTGCVRKNYTVFIFKFFFIAEKVNKAQQQHSSGQKHNFLVLKKIVLFVCLFLLYTGSIFRGKFKYPSVLPYGPVNSPVFKWYLSMVRCKSYGLLSDEW